MAQNLEVQVVVRIKEISKEGLETVRFIGESTKSLPLQGDSINLQSHEVEKVFREFRNADLSNIVVEFRRRKRRKAARESQKEERRIKKLSHDLGISPWVSPKGGKW